MPVPPFDMRGLLPPFIGPNPTTQVRSPYLVTMVDLITQLATTPQRRQPLAQSDCLQGTVGAGQL